MIRREELHEIQEKRKFQGEDILCKFFFGSELGQVRPPSAEVSWIKMAIE